MIADRWRLLLHAIIVIVSVPPAPPQGGFGLGIRGVFACIEVSFFERDGPPPAFLSLKAKSSIPQPLGHGEARYSGTRRFGCWAKEGRAQLGPKVPLSPRRIESRRMAYKRRRRPQLHREAGFTLMHLSLCGTIFGHFVCTNKKKFLYEQFEVWSRVLCKTIFGKSVPYVHVTHANPRNFLRAMGRIYFYYPTLFKDPQTTTKKQKELSQDKGSGKIKIKIKIFRRHYFNLVGLIIIIIIIIITIIIMIIILIIIFWEYDNKNSTIESINYLINNDNTNDMRNNIFQYSTIGRLLTIRKMQIV
eukprot:gene11719-8064_t